MAVYDAQQVYTKTGLPQGKKSKVKAKAASKKAMKRMPMAQQGMGARSR